jgi:hypothetical protein
MKHIAIAAALLASIPGVAHDIITTKITWSREVSRIAYARCLECHRDGGPAFSLATYAEARPWAKAIKEEVLSRRMPPWNAVKGFGQFRNDRGLTQEELSLIAEWVEGGAPEGNPLYLPDRPAIPELVSLPTAREIAFSGSSILSHAVQAVGIRVTATPEPGSLQVIASRPDGSVEPLVWIRKSVSSDPGAYWFASTIALPARTKLLTIPASGAAALLVR